MIFLYNPPNIYDLFIKISSLSPPTNKPLWLRYWWCTGFISHAASMKKREREKEERGIRSFGYSINKFIHTHLRTLSRTFSLPRSLSLDLSLSVCCSLFSSDRCHRSWKPYESSSSHRIAAIGLIIFGQYTLRCLPKTLSDFGSFMGNMHYATD